ncbi:MAG: flagellar hook-basal body complex protein FliE [Gammaproteobacteria bacterium]
MSEVNINQLLSQLRETAALAKGGNSSEASEASGVDFSQLLSNAVDHVNEAQQTASDMKSAYLSGESNLDIAEVMVASQKAGIEFQMLMQVRNKLVSAYQEVMGMPI